MYKLSWRCLAFAIIPLITACATPSQKLISYAQSVSVYADSAIVASGCVWKGEVTGSEGHWYSFLFYNNDTMIQGAVNDIKNQAASLGANRVYLNSPIHFKTSVTFLGNAYLCQ